MRMNRQTDNALFHADRLTRKTPLTMQTVQDNPSGGLLRELDANSMMNRNDGRLEFCKGRLMVNSFDGVIASNLGVIRINGGRIETNHDKVRENSEVGRILTNRGSIVRNNGDIGNNFGKVRNTDNGLVDLNDEYGNVTGGTVSLMAGGTAMNCSIERMTGGTARGVNTFIALYEGGRISRAVSLDNITLAPGLRVEDIEWVEALAAEKTADRARTDAKAV